MLYSKDETPLEGDREGNVNIERAAEEVFRENTIASFEGKPVTIDHPDDFVSPDNWASLAKGVCQNVRRGEREQQDLIIADLLITDAEAIEYVKSGKLRQVSCGYDADYEQIVPGRGEQKNIIGNHVALVQKGRAGFRCVIMDSDKKEVIPMTFKDKLKKLFSKTIDDMEEEEAQEIIEEPKEEEKGSIEERLARLEDIIAQLVESDKEVHESMDCWRKAKDSEETEEEEKKKEEEEKEKEKEAEDKKKGKDSAPTSDTLSRVEILNPGYKPKAKTTDSVKREVLEALYQTQDGKKLLEPFTGKVKDWQKVDPVIINATFTAASELKAQSNNARFITRDMVGDFSAASSIIEMNKKHADFWQKK